MGKWFTEKWQSAKTWAAEIWRDKKNIILTAAEGVVLNEFSKFKDELTEAIKTEGFAAIERLHQKYKAEIHLAFEKARKG